MNHCLVVAGLSSITKYEPLSNVGHLEMQQSCVTVGLILSRKVGAIAKFSARTSSREAPTMTVSPTLGNRIPITVPSCWLRAYHGTFHVSYVAFDQFTVEYIHPF